MWDKYRNKNRIRIDHWSFETHCRGQDKTFNTKWCNVHNYNGLMFNSK